MLNPFLNLKKIYSFAFFFFPIIFWTYRLQAQNNLCENSLVFCSTDIITYAAGVNAGTAQTGASYDCLATQPNPAWFYMQMQNNGDVTIKIDSNPPRDIDFCLWGPFEHPTTPCVAGLTQDKVEDCSYAPLTNPEYADITDGITGEFYILLLTNYSNQPTEVTFQQTGGNGMLNCEIVFDCSIVAISAVPSECNPSSNTFSVSGQIIFTNPPSTGTLTISDNSGMNQSFSAPFVSPQAYTLNNIPCDGTIHTLNVSFSDNTTCSNTTTYNAPEALCPIAKLKGGGQACQGDSIPLLIELIGEPPFTFAYAIDNITQPAITDYYGPSPYILQAFSSGIYTMVSVSNNFCSGNVSGSASVLFHPLPTIDLGADTGFCSTYSISIDAGSGFKSYLWNTGATSQFINVTQGGLYQVTVTDWNNCSNSDSIQVVEHPLPSPLQIKHN